MARDIVAKEIRLLSSTGSVVEQDAGGEQRSFEKSDKIAQNVAMRFKVTFSKFCGDIGECWQEFVDEYRQVSRDYRLFNYLKLD